MGKLRLSYSRLDTANRCGYKGYLKYIKKIVPFVPVNYPLVTGIAFHALVDEMYKTLDFDRRSLLRNWKYHFESELEKHSRTFSNTKGYEQQLKYGYGLVNNFHKFAQREGYLVKPYQSEWKFKLPWNDYVVVGKVDLLIKKEKFEVVDFKTSWKVSTQENLDTNQQLSIYDWAVKTLLGFTDTVVALFYPRKNQILRTERTEEHHHKVLSELDKLAVMIRAGNFAPNIEHCPKCEFKKYCKYYKK